MIGKVKGSFIAAEFDSMSSFIGFFGVQTPDHILQLGFIVQDIACSEELAGTYRGGIYESKDVSPVGLIVAIVAAVTLITAVVLFLAHQCRKSKK